MTSKEPEKPAQAAKKPRRQRGRTDRSAMFPLAPVADELPPSYAALFADLKLRIRAERLRVVVSGNAAMIML